MGLLALLPVLAHAPAWWEGRLLGPGDGAALHFPLRAQAWTAYRERGEIPSWNPSIFSGTPLLAAYRPGAFYPPMVVLSLLRPFPAFQLLVLFSLSAAALLTYLYLRRLGAGRSGAYLSGLCFSLGPYLMGHLEDSATIVAAPMLPLLLLAAESHVNRSTPGRAAGLAGAVALLLLAGSPEAARAGAALVAGRLLVAFLVPVGGRRPDLGATLLALLAGGLVAAPQIIPTLLLAREAGPSVTALGGGSVGALPGATGLVLRYVSHTPAPSLALAALPLALTQTPVRVLGVALGLCLALQWGRGPLAAPGALALVFDLTLATLAGLSFSAQWAVRREAMGRRLRAYFLFSSLASAAALSVSAAALGPLPETLAGSVGVLAMALILYFSLAGSVDPVRAGVWLLPLTTSFLLQAHGRRIWDGAPTEEALVRGTPTRDAIDRAMGRRRAERILTLTRGWPGEEAADLAHANLAVFAGRSSINGYDPMVPLRTRMAYDDMGPGGTLRGAFFRTDPARLEILGVRWVQVHSSALTTRPDRWGFGDTLDITLDTGQPRFFPLPIAPATEVRLASWMSDAVQVHDEEAVAEIEVRLASGRALALAVRAGRETAEWAYERPDVRAAVAHQRAPILETWPEARGTFSGQRYLGILPLPGRYYVDGIRIERLPGRGHLTISRLTLLDESTGRFTPVSLASGYVSDPAHFREVVATPLVRLFEVRGSPGHAHVSERLRVLPNGDAVLRALRSPAIIGMDARREALAAASDVRGVSLPEGARASRAEVVRASGGHLDVRAEGPGLLVVAEGWDPGWSGRLDGQRAAVLRVNHAQMGVVLPAGPHRITLDYRAPGLVAGFALSGIGAIGLVVAQAGRRPGPRLS